MCHFFHIFFCIITVLSAAGCRDKGYIEELNRINSFVKSHPDSALSLIEDFDVERLSGNREKAYYAYVYTKARHNCNVLTFDDSLMHFAERWMLKHGSNDEKAQILYCIGNSLTIRDSFAQASDYYSKAEIFAMESQNDYMIAAINNALGYSYRFQMDYEEALVHFAKASSILKNLGDMRQYLIPKYQEITVLEKLGQTDKALRMAEEAEALAVSVNDTAMVLRLNSLTAIIAASMSPTPEEASDIKSRLMMNFHKYGVDSIPVPLYNTTGLLLFYQGDLRNARFWLQKALDHTPPLSTRLGCYYTLSMIAEAEGKYKEALEYERNVTSLQDTLFTETKESMIQVAERKYRNEYLQNSYDVLALKHKYQNIITIISAAVFILLATSAVIYYRKRIKDSKKKIEEAMSYIDSVSAGYNELQSRYDSLQKNNGDLNEVNSKMLNMLALRMDSIRQLLEMASLYESRPAIFYSKFKEHIKVSPQNNVELENEIISTANLQFHNLINDLKAKSPDLSVHELCYCSLICLGFSQQSIRVLYDHTNINSIYSLRAKIRAKLGISNSNRSLDNYFRELIQQNYTA